MLTVYRDERKYQVYRGDGRPVQSCVAGRIAEPFYDPESDTYGVMAWALAKRPVLLNEVFGKSEEVAFDFYDWLNGECDDD